MSTQTKSKGGDREVPVESASQETEQITRRPDTFKRKRFPSLGRFWPPFERDDVVAELKRREARKDLEDPAQGGRPYGVVQLTVTVAAYVDGTARTFSEQTVSWIEFPDGGAKRFRVLIKGYQTLNELGTGGMRMAENLPFALVAEVDRSPFTFRLEATTEEVIIGVQTVNDDGILCIDDEIKITSVTLI